MDLYTNASKINVEAINEFINFNENLMAKHTAQLLHTYLYFFIRVRYRYVWAN